jgi:microcystin-dependent protein
VTKLNLQYDIVNLTPADAIPVEANYSRIEQHINQEVIERDGSVAMRAELTLSGDPLTPLGAATKQYVDLLLPIGVIMPYGGLTLPPITNGPWMMCDGSQLESAAYPALFNVIGTAFVVGTPVAGRFNLPDFRARFPYGATLGVAGKGIGTLGGTADATVVGHTHPINHTHPAFATELEGKHTHLGGDHTHSVNINSGPHSATHRHGMRGLEGPAGGVQGAFGLSRVVDQGATSVDVLGLTQAADTTHTHNVSGATGTALQPLTTGNSNPLVHSHPIAPPAFSGTSGAASGAVSATNANMPPYIGLNWIIKVI